MLSKRLSLACLAALLSIGTFANASSNCRTEADPCFYAQLELLRQGKWCIEELKGTVTFSCMVLGESASVSCPGGYRKITPTEQADLEAKARKIEVDNLSKQKKDCPKENISEDESAAAMS